MKEIELTQGLKTQVDDEDFEMLNQFRWCAGKSRNTYYASRHSPTINGKRTTIKMHHVIIGIPPVGFVSDHEDGNGLNNRRYNLRNITNRQNCQNRKNAPGTSKYPGVSRCKERENWEAQININGFHKHLGRFLLEIDAFSAYKDALEAIGENLI